LLNPVNVLVAGCARFMIVFHTNWFWNFRMVTRTKRRRWSLRRRVTIRMLIMPATSAWTFSKTNGRLCTMSEPSCCQYRVYLEVPIVLLLCLLLYLLLCNVCLMNNTS